MNEVLIATREAEVSLIGAVLIESACSRYNPINEVKQILAPRPYLGRKKAKELAGEYGVHLSTIFKARGRQGCYSDSIYD